MKVIEVFSSPHDLKKLSKCMAAFCPPCSIGRQVARNNVRRRWPGNLSEISPSSQISCLINFFGLAKIRIASGSKFGLRARRMAAIAISLGVDDVASQPHQFAV